MVNVLNAERMLIQAKLVWQVMNVESALTMMIVKDKKSVWMMANVVRTDKLSNHSKRKLFFVKLRESEGQRVDLGRSLKGHL